MIESGASYGYPMQDKKVTVHEGKKAFLDAVSNATPIIMELIVDVALTAQSRS